MHFLSIYLKLKLYWSLFDCLQNSWHKTYFWCRNSHFKIQWISSEAHNLKQHKNCNLIGVVYLRTRVVCTALYTVYVQTLKPHVQNWKLHPLKVYSKINFSMSCKQGLQEKYCKAVQDCFGAPVTGTKISENTTKKKYKIKLLSLRIKGP